MSELITNASPVLPPSGAGNANPLSQGDAVARPGESARTNTESGAASPFASVLKSRMDKKPDAADAADSASPVPSEAQTAAGNTVGLDISALFPFLETGSDAATGLTAGEASPDETLAPELEAAVEPALDKMLLALPTTPAAAQAAGPAASLPVSAPARSAAATPPSATPPSAATVNASPRTQHAEASDEAFSFVSAQSGGTSQSPGKIAPNPAINADAGTARASGEQKLEPAANDFHALLERAATQTPVAGSGNGPSAGTQLRIDTPLGQSGWHAEMGQKLTWMAGNNRQQADLVLNPPHLGRIEVSLTMNGDQASAVFTSANPAVREALENSLHRLREVLADAGVSLGQTQVGSESPHQSSRKDEPDFGMNQGMRYASAIPLPAAHAVAGTSAGRSMIDIFA